MAEATPTGTTASSELELPAHWLIGFLHRILEGHQRIDVVVNHAGYNAMGLAVDIRPFAPRRRDR